MNTPRCARCQRPLPLDYAPKRPCPACLLQLGLEDDAEAFYTRGFEPAPPLAPEELARLFPKLDIIGLLGQGGMGAVYRAHQRELGRDVALKLLRPLDSEAEEFLERFAREARALARLAHPNIVAIHDFGQVEGQAFLVMEYVDGTNLRSLLELGELQPRQALELVGQICTALQYAHGEGVVHRDIKPENILVDRSGRVKIVDFGLAKLGTAEQGRLTHTRQTMGTPQYMAPEQIERPREVDHRADLYSLGVVLYELLTGELPLGRFASPSEKVRVDVRLDEVVLKALEKEPSRRYQQASEISTDIEGLDRGVQRPRRKLPGRKRSERKAAHRLRREHRRLPSWAAFLLLLTCLPISCIGSCALFMGSSFEPVSVQVQPGSERTAPPQSPLAPGSDTRSPEELEPQPLDLNGRGS